MAIYSGYVTNSNDDWDDIAGTGATTIRAIRDRDIGDGSPNNWSGAYARCDTSGLSGDGITITAATVHFYNNSYTTTPKADPEGTYIQMWDKDTSDWVYVETTTTARVVGWDSYTLSSGELEYVYPTDLTRFRFIITDPNTWGQLRTWSIRAWDWSSATTYAVRLEVEHDQAIPTSGDPGFIQSKAANNTTGGELSVTLDSAPTEGNWLIAAMCERSLVPSGSSMTLSGAGWTYDGYERIATDDTTYRRGMAIYHKLVGAGEGADITGTFDNALGNATIHVAEFSGLTSFDQIVWSDNGTTADATTLATSAVTTDQSTALIAMFGFKESLNDPSGGGGCSYSNSFTEGASHVGTYNYTFYNSVGWLNYSGSGTTSTTITCDESTTSNKGIQSALLSFNTTLDESEPPAPVARKAKRFIVIG